MEKRRRFIGQRKLSVNDMQEILQFQLVQNIQP